MNIAKLIQGSPLSADNWMRLCTNRGSRHPEPRRRRRISKLQAFSHLEISSRFADSGWLARDPL